MPGPASALLAAWRQIGIWQRRQSPFVVAVLPIRAHVAALATGDGWIDRGGTIPLFGPSGSGKSHVSIAAPSVMP